MPMSAHDDTTPPPPTTFGQALRALREAKGFGLVELAKAVPIDASVLSKIERGLRPPPHRATIGRIVRLLGVKDGSEEFEALYRLTGRPRQMTDTELFGLIKTHAVRAYMRSPLVEERETEQVLTAEAARLVDDLGVAPHEAQPEPAPEFCADLAEMIGRATSAAITMGAVEIVVRGKNGAARRFQERDEVPF